MDRRWGQLTACASVLADAPAPPGHLVLVSTVASPLLLFAEVDSLQSWLLAHVSWLDGAFREADAAEPVVRAASVQPAP